MSESVNLPALGESVTEGTVTRWLKNVGDRVEVDEPLLEVSTDKVDTEIPSPVAGVIEQILVAEDETVEVGTPLVTIGDGSGAGSSEPEAPQEAVAPAPEQQQPPAAEAPVAAAQPAPAAPAPAVQEPAGAPVPPPPAAPAPATETPAQPAQGQQQDQGATAAPSSPEPGLEAEVPSDEAPAPGDPAQQQVTPPAPAESVDPAPAAQQAPAAQPAPAAVPAAQPAPAAQPESSAPAAQPTETDEAPSGANAGYVTPIVRKLASERGVDLASITGTGVGGRIRKQDVLDASTSAPAGAGAAPAAATAQRTEVEVSPLRGTTVKMSRLRKVVAERAVVSMQSTAQLTSVVEVDVTKVAAFRDKVKKQFQEKTGNKLSFLPFFAIAAAEALKTYPIINATVDGDSIVYPDHENISIAVDTERGLLTPVIRNAGEKNIAELAGDIADLALRTRENKLKPDELSGGTFTLTNTGSRGALFDTPVVFLPQVAILGTGIVTKRPVVLSGAEGDVIAIRSTVYLALSYDHRIVDGADAARFLVAVKNRLEAGDFEGDLGI
ncbi:2-oxoglutarate dehydrogenase, E2 component, dihydrolipoamide succinyltransferase [Desertivibrio insolitus]|uniref:2-oxoglutarate dehydrogenase, E2 component, dihydrolipoamide succinyltransferase n=1 Tax=Herbiconiux sp. SYSU D00978 TaxID=2812562 RepID=UPI001A97BC0A|nr:2-oxoglutarate dehydrogenase, E2 component, dihydrolipoamide succinyltransferase [Herbiconiux sp. SYSU D00978]